MSRHYSTPESERSAYTLPDIEVFQQTAREFAESDSNEELIREYMRRPEFRLASMNSRAREAMFDAMIEEEGIEGGWFWWTCLPGCLPGDCVLTGFCGDESAIDGLRAAWSEGERDLTALSRDELTGLREWAGNY